MFEVKADKDISLLWKIGKSFVNLSNVWTISTQSVHYHKQSRMLYIIKRKKPIKLKMYIKNDNLNNC